MFENFMTMMNDPANKWAIVNALGNAGAAFSEPGSWQGNLGNMMGNYSAMQQYNNAMNKQMGGQSQTNAPTPASITIKYPNAVGTPGSQGDVGASAAPSGAQTNGSQLASNPMIPQGTGLPTNNPMQPQTQQLGPMSVGSMMGSYSNLPFLLALRR